MRPLVWLRLVWCVGAMAPVLAHAQVLAPKPPEVAAPADTDTDTGTSRSLFEVSPNQFQFGGRLSSVKGDPARFQRYGDYRDGVLFTEARYSRDDPGGAWLFRAAADNVGYRDQRYVGSYQRPGRFTVSGAWDQIPQFYSTDTKTPYTMSGSPLLLDDATQRAIQTGQATLSAWVPLAPQFDLRERRDIGTFRLTVTPETALDLTGAFTTTRHRGELPWGASFGFGNDVEVALPYDSRTNDLNLGAQWNGSRGMVRLAYDGSWFNNLDDTLVWDSPLRLDDSTSAPGRGQMALWPSNSSHTVSGAASVRFARRSQLTGVIAYGVRSNDEPLQPFTINPTLPQLALPQTTAGAEAHVLNTTLNFVTRPAKEWSFNARLRRYDYDNKTGHVAIPQFINYDTSVKASSTGGPEPYAHTRSNFDGDATWNGIQRLALTAGYSLDMGGYDFRIFDTTAEHTMRLVADAIGSQWMTFRAQYEQSWRSGSGLNEDLLVQIGEQPAMRHYDVADRMRTKFTGQITILASETLTFDASTSVGRDDYDNSYFGLQESAFQVFGFGADYKRANGFGGGGSYNYEHYDGLQRSRQANPGQENDPNRDWMADSAENVHYFSLYATPPRIGKNTELRVSYDFSHAEGSYLYTIVAGGPLTPPNQLPNVYNKLQQFHLDARYRLSKQLAVSLAYLYEPFRVHDFAFDPTVVNGIVQPSSLVMGYVYRPYTAHSAFLGLKYLW